MINNNELRVGNWVALGDYQDVQVNRILDHPNSFDPIPLTSEILEKCGFTYSKHEGITRITDDFDEPEKGDTHNWTLSVGKSGYVQDLSRFEIVKFGEGDYLWAYQWLRVKLTTLHQLQNLFYALSGKELEVNL